MLEETPLSVPLWACLLACARCSSCRSGTCYSNRARALSIHAQRTEIKTQRLVNAVSTGMYLWNTFRLFAFDLNINILLGAADVGQEAGAGRVGKNGVVYRLAAVFGKQTFVSHFFHLFRFDK